MEQQTRNRTFSEEEERIINAGVKELFNSPKIDNKEFYEALSGRKKSEDMEVKGEATAKLKAQTQKQEEQAVEQAKCGARCVIM